MAVARMRFAHQAIEQLRQEDPNTPITVHYLRHLMKSGAIPTVKIGNNRRLVNYDILLEYLAQSHDETEKGYGTIRRVL
ncbi:MAG: hypothetical protein RR219_08700 [Clostridiales bacterium]